MVHVANAEGHRKMLAFESNSSSHTTTESNTKNNNLSHILINTISTKFGDATNDPGSTVILTNSQNTAVGPILPTYKSNSLNLSCIIEEEPPLGMMSSNIREATSGMEDPNANVALMISDANSNSSSPTPKPVSTSSHGNQEIKVHENIEIVSKSFKRSAESSLTFSTEKVTHSTESSSSITKSRVNPDPVEFHQETTVYHSASFSNKDDSLGDFGSIPIEVPDSGTSDGVPESSPPHSSVSHKQKSMNGTKSVSLKRVSFGSSKGSMVETLIFESPNAEESRDAGKAGTDGDADREGASKVLNAGSDTIDSPTTAAGGGSTGGSRPASRVRVTFFESEKPLAVTTPDSDTIDFDGSNMTTHPGTPNDTSTPNNYARSLSTEINAENPFRPDGDLSKEADLIVELIKEGKPINDETLRSISPINETNETMMHSSNYTNNLTASPPQPTTGKNGSANGTEVQRGVVVPPTQTAAVEHVTLKKKKGCCVIQ